MIYFKYMLHQGKDIKDHLCHCIGNPNCFILGKFEKDAWLYGEASLTNDEACHLEQNLGLYCFKLLTLEEAIQFVNSCAPTAGHGNCVGTFVTNEEVNKKYEVECS